MPTPLSHPVLIRLWPCINRRHPFTDAIPYYAAYLALLSSSDKERRGEAPKMWEQYTEFVARARRASTPAVLPGNMTKGGLIQPAQIARNG